MFRTKEKPFEWIPEDGSPISTSPDFNCSPVIAESLSRNPRAVPERSSSVTIPGSEAVSPPASVTLANSHAFASEAPTAAWTSGSGFGTAM